MNKLMGFYELQDMSLPSVQWKEYTGIEKLDPYLLWTVRSAVYRGNDLNLPRLVGATATDAMIFAKELHTKLKDNGMVIYYPYFLAQKSGTLNVYSDKVVIEAVNKDLWNLVTYSDREVTIEILGKERIVNGNDSFLSKDEEEKILSNLPDIKRRFRDELLEGKGVLLEWSIARKSDLLKQPIGEDFLIFYEVRTIN